MDFANDVLDIPSFFLNSTKRKAISTQITPFPLLTHHTIIFFFPHLGLVCFLVFCGLFFSFFPSLLLSYSPTQPIHLLFQKSRKEHSRRRNKRNKSGVDEKKKTQGMRRDSAHFCGPSPLFSHPQLRLLFYSIMGENWMTKMLENWEVTDILYP